MRKYVALCVHFNITPAVCLTSAYTGCLVVAGAFGKLPVVHTAYGGTLGFVAKATCMPVFFVTMFGLRDFLWLLGHKGTFGKTLD